MKNILFVCTHNAGRSQVAQAFWRRHAPADVRAESAGQESAKAPWPDDAPVRLMVETIVYREARDCLRRGRCGEVLAAR